MNTHIKAKYFFLPLMLLMALLISACNLGSGPESVEQITPQVTNTVPPTRTPSGTLNVPTTLPLTSVAATRQPGQVFPTSVAGAIPTAVIPPTQSQPSVPVSIVILAPVPGNVVSGNVQVLGSAIHPQFLQYQLEYGPDPNGGNLWFPATGAIQTPVLNNLLGIWNTTAIQDGVYQLRLRVYLRDASSLTTVVNGIRIQNQRPTPQPSATPNIPRPIAAFTQNQTSGQAPLRVQFTSQSTGEITGIQWNFGDGSGSTERNPSHDFVSPGLYTVTLSVSGPGGTSNVSTQINVQSPTAPTAGFTSDKTSGPAPLVVQFTDQSQGTINTYRWNFSDGTSSGDRNPVHTFITPGTYNVFLEVSGPGGTSSVRREITVAGPTPTPFPTVPVTIIPVEGIETQAPASPNADFSSETTGDLSIRFTDISSSPNGAVTGWVWDFGDGSPSSSEQNPVRTYGAPGNYQVTLTITDTVGSTSTVTKTVNVPQPVAPAVLPQASFTTEVTSDLTLRFIDTSSSANGQITTWAWSFGDGSTSAEQNPVHTYAAAGDYQVSLTVTDITGATSNPILTSVNVPQPAQRPQASFTHASTGDLTVQFTDTTISPSGAAITAWQWTFGDGSIDNLQNPSHTFPTAGSYDVTLTVTDANGQTSEPFTSTIEVSPGVIIQPDQPDPIGNTPILPDLNSAPLQNRLREIYNVGVNAGNRASVFAVSGDESAEQAAYLDPFRDPANYTLDDSTSDLQSIIDWYNTTDLNGVTSFNRTSLAVGNGWTVEYLLDPARRNIDLCQEIESPMACELRITQPAVVLISIGYHDIAQGTDPETFRQRLQQVVQTATDIGVIPVLSTVAPQPGNAEATSRINQVIIEVANANNIPVYNLWAALNGLPNNGIDGSGLPSVAPQPGDITANATSSYGASARNRDLLRLLNDLRSTLFPDVSAS